MGSRLFVFALFALAVAVIFHRDRCIFKHQVHTPATAVQLSPNHEVRPYYTTGPLSEANLPPVTALQLLNRKRINNFVVNHYNQYKFEFTFADLGYTSNFMFGFFTEDSESFSFTERLGFNLNEAMLDGKMNFNFHKKGFNLTVRQHLDTENDFTVTVFNVTSVRKNHTLHANMTHIVRNTECFTAIRDDDVVSHKCFGGMAAGKVKLDRILVENGEKMKRNSVFNPKFNVTRAVFDGLRGSGMHWQWLWGMASGFSKPEFYALNHTIPKEKFLGFNFGNLNGQGEDFFFLNGQIIPIEGLKFQIDDKFPLNTNITFTATKPKLEAKFLVLSKHHEKKDLGFAKLDLLKAEGNWAGWVQGPDHEKIEFYLIAGHIETSNSLF